MSRPSALEAGVRLLAARALTVHEVRFRLARRGYGEEEVTAAVGSLLSSGYLDDRTLAYNLATTLAVRRVFGRARVAVELKRRGIAQDIIAEALERAFADLDEDDLALRAAGKHPVPASGREGDRARQRLARALLRRGFSSGAVTRVLRGAGRTEPGYRAGRGGPGGDPGGSGGPESEADEGPLEAHGPVEENFDDDNEFPADS